ncbi:hypothetical protein GCM10010266_72940 [Streptomyces griseomycini]|nr:hypothetical protein GCM10010266_72940 [Streptomyces griseomycini]
MAAGFGPLVVLLGQHRPGEPDDGGAVGEDSDHVGAAPDLLVQPLLRIVRPDLPPDLPREGGEGQQVVLAASKWAAVLGNLASSASRTCRIWAWTASVSGCSKTVRSRVATQGWADFGTWLSKFLA